MLQTYNDENDCILTSQKMSLNENGFDNGQNKDFLDLTVASYVPFSRMISALLAELGFHLQICILGKFVIFFDIKGFGSMVFCRSSQS